VSLLSSVISYLLLSAVKHTLFGNWEIISPRSNYLGLSYGEWARNWMNWLVSKDPDSNNNGPVVYIRGVDFAKEYSLYGHFIRVEKDRLRMSLDQALLCPMMACYIDVRHHTNAETHEKRLSKVFRLVINGDYPPDQKQFSIEGNSFPISLEEFLVVTPEFKLHVPSPTYENTLGSILDVPLIFEGDWDCVVGGYYVLIKPRKVGKQIIALNATAEDGYHIESIVEVEVFDESKTKRSLAFRDFTKEQVKEILQKQGATVGGVGSTLARIEKYLDTNH
jgi:hypothetical protein